MNNLLRVSLLWTTAGMAEHHYVVRLRSYNYGYFAWHGRFSVIIRQLVATPGGGICMTDCI
jgi:hypothetical protein